ncbi:Brp/Blh family beta-carotene 15,15'-dioxygenase [Natronomonas salsuginis]|uniref:Probable beta-carotene 15,15'-dioxygenase n=1 Tax=Natronomonas salsuginis TaxID=2217661 RepID=A0A4U5JEF8_9EURY|nr:Brp/Blh family beta-carotene 15,15'-dioxygenase [Natronomonas salsuginis]TKR26057.1 beta-carotene 15,15'-dioxygenase [Natronomonas salsuginis]
MGVTVGRPTPTFRAVYDRVAARPAWTVCALLVVGSILGRLFDVSLPPTVRYLPLAASVVVFGLPHGAVDYLIPAQLDGRSLAASMTLVGSLYAVLGGAYTALWLTEPLAAATIFIALTWFHWGQGDVHALVSFVGADHIDSTGLRVATCFVRGGLPMFVPFLAFPERYRAVLETWVELFGGDLSATWAFVPHLRLFGGAVFLAVTVGVLLVGHRRAGETRGWRIDAGETALLWALFFTVPPILAVGVYFCVWHSLRHVLRFSAIDEQEVRTTAGRLFSAFARKAAPLTVLALVFLVLFGLLAPASPSNASEFTGLYLVFVAVLTLPHVAVVTWMDHREGVWNS